MSYITIPALLPEQSPLYGRGEIDIEIPDVGWGREFGEKATRILPRALDLLQPVVVSSRHIVTFSPNRFHPLRTDADIQHQESVFISGARFAVNTDAKNKAFTGPVVTVLSMKGIDDFSSAHPAVPPSIAAIFYVLHEFNELSQMVRADRYVTSTVPTALPTYSQLPTEIAATRSAIMSLSQFGAREDWPAIYMLRQLHGLIYNLND